jgi:hypothetical protein
MPDMVSTALKTTLVDLPVAGLKRALGMAEKRSLTETAWRSYDASMRLVSASIDSLYRSGLLGALIARPVEGLLRWQRLNNALAGAFFTTVWRAMDLPTANEVNTLREEIHVLAACVKAHGDKLEALTSSPRRRKLPEVAVGRSIGAAA